MPPAITRLIAAAAIATLIACGSPPPAGTVTSVTIDGGDRTIVLGDAPTLTAAVEITGNTTTGYTLGALEGPHAGSNDAFVRSYDRDGNHRWTRQFGTPSEDFALGIATGYTDGALEGSNAGGSDAFIRSYDRDGNLRWTRQLGTNSDDVSLGIATDPSGNAYTTSNTNGALEGSNAGSNDAFLRSYDRDGNLRWTRQFGTASGDFALRIATDANGNTTTTGYTLGALEGPNAGGSNAFIRSYGR